MSIYNLHDRLEANTTQHCGDFPASIPLGTQSLVFIALLAPQQMWIQNLPSPYSKNKKESQNSVSFQRCGRSRVVGRVPVARLDLDMIGLKIQNVLLFP